MDKPEKVATYSSQTQDEDKQNKRTLEKTEGAIKNGQARESSNIQLTRHRTKTNKANKR